MRVRNGFNDTFSLLLAVQLETAMHARYDKVEPRQDVLWIVKRAVSQNIRFNALEDAEAISIAFIEAVRFGMLLGNLIKR